MLLYMERLCDWDLVLRHREEPVDIAAERQAQVDVLRTCAQICRDLAPRARAAWHAEAELRDGEVTLPAHVVDGYARMRDAGLVSLSVREEYGGFALPQITMSMILQMLARTDLGLQTMIGLQTGVADDIQTFASPELCAAYLPRFARGELLGAMDLTEPHAGSDLGAIVTRARDTGDHSIIDGHKIFITNGGAEIHLVLARDEDTFEASKGTTRGLSLFLVPRTLPCGTRNGLTIERLERKVGLHGSATCEIRFSGAVGYRIAKKGEGFRAMLKLMNAARLGVAAQAVGIAEGALDCAAQYAAERVQFGRPVAEQPAVKGLLLRMELLVAGGAALVYRAARQLDEARALATYLERESANLSEAERTALDAKHRHLVAGTRMLTPLAKYACGEACDQVTRMAVQIHGGMGFMRENAAVQLHLDGIITTIYEGTSEIQTSFVLKEIGRGALDAVFAELRAELSKHGGGERAALAGQVNGALEQILDSLAALAGDPGRALARARNIAEMVTTVVAATELLHQAAADESRTRLARLWLRHRLPELELHGRLVEITDD
jgi:hypothetical protein